MEILYVILVLISIILFGWWLAKAPEPWSYIEWLMLVSYLLIFVGYVISTKEIEKHVYIEAIHHNPYEMKIDKTYRDGELVSQDTVYVLKIKNN